MPSNRRNTFNMRSLAVSSDRRLMHHIVEEDSSDRNSDPIRISRHQRSRTTLMMNNTQVPRLEFPTFNRESEARAESLESRRRTVGDLTRLSLIENEHPSQQQAYKTSFNGQQMINNHKQ